MKVAISWTGGKDSALACYKVMQEHDVAMFVNFVWQKPSLSHPNLLTKLQAEALQKRFLWDRLEPPYLDSYRE
jgi:diphthamide synthase (EF-2-diphthine--ammonia ligase)